MGLLLVLDTTKGYPGIVIVDGGGGTHPLGNIFMGSVRMGVNLAWGIRVSKRTSPSCCSCACCCCCCCPFNSIRRRAGFFLNSRLICVEECFDRVVTERNEDCCEYDHVDTDDDGIVEDDDSTTTPCLEKEE